MRRFVAIGVPGEVRDVLLDAVSPLRDGRDDELRWTRPEGWHVTLAFLGEVADDAVPAVVEVVRGVLDRVEPPRRLRLGRPGRFRREVLWVGVGDEPDGSVVGLGAALQGALDDAGLPVDHKQVRPHVTLARARRKGTGAVSAALVDSVEVPSVRWHVETVDVWRSRLGDGPARYEVDAAVPLG